MENLKIVWHYAGSFWDMATPFLILFLGFWIGIKIGIKWGKKEGIKRERTRMWRAIEARLPRIRAIIFNKAEGKEMVVQGALRVRPAEPVDIEDGLPFGFRFETDPKQWEADPYCPPCEKPESPA